MKNSAVNPYNKAVAEKIRSRATKFDDGELRAEAVRLAQIVEQAGAESPAAVLDLIFRNPIAIERHRGLDIEAIAHRD